MERNGGRPSIKEKQSASNIESVKVTLASLPHELSLPDNSYSLVSSPTDCVEITAEVVVGKMMAKIVIVQSLRRQRCNASLVTPRIFSEAADRSIVR